MECPICKKVGWVAMCVDHKVVQHDGCREVVWIPCKECRVTQDDKWSCCVCKKFNESVHYSSTLRDQYCDECHAVAMRAKLEDVSLVITCDRCKVRSRDVSFKAAFCKWFCHKCASIQYGMLRYSKDRQAILFNGKSAAKDHTIPERDTSVKYEDFFTFKNNTAAVPKASEQADKAPIL